CRPIVVAGLMTARAVWLRRVPGDVRRAGPRQLPTGSDCVRSGTCAEGGVHGEVVAGHALHGKALLETLAHRASVEAGDAPHGLHGLVHRIDHEAGDTVVDDF